MQSVAAEVIESTRPHSAGTAGQHRGVRFRRGETLFTPGLGAGMIYIVRTGCVRLFKAFPDGRSINLGLLGPGTLFTQEDEEGGLASGAYAEALIDSTIIVVRREGLTELVASSPQLASAIVSGVGRRLTELQTLVEQLLARDTSVRLATTLHLLASRFGRPLADGMTVIGLPLTHQSLAGMIGANRVTVTRKLLELQEAGCIRSVGRHALAVDPEKLIDLARPARGMGRANEASEAGEVDDGRNSGQ